MQNYWKLFQDKRYMRNHKPPCVMNSEATIDRITTANLSVSRFGDGEFDMLLNINHPKFQKSDRELTKKLFEVLHCKDDNVLVCIPDVFSNDSLDRFTAKARRHWQRVLYNNRKRLYEILEFDRQYGDALFSRPYVDLNDKGNVAAYFKKMKAIWENRKIVIVEGRYTRFGVGNDLLDNVESVVRVLCPEKDAYNKYGEIFEECKKWGGGDALFLLALGPTATVLAYDLCKIGFQAIDIGHLDIEYEWFNQGANDKVNVANKYVNETDGVITDDNDRLQDDDYEASIRARIY